MALAYVDVEFATSALRGCPDLSKLTPAQERVFHALRVIAKPNGRIEGRSWQEIAERAHTTKTSVGRALKALEREELVVVENAGKGAETSVLWVAMSVVVEDGGKRQSRRALMKGAPRRKQRSDKGQRRAKKSVDNAENSAATTANSAK